MRGIVYGYYVKNSGIGRFISETLKHVRNPSEYEVLTLEDTIRQPTSIARRIIPCVRDTSFLSIEENRNFSWEIERIRENYHILHSHGIYDFVPDFYTAHICLASYFASICKIFGREHLKSILPILEIEKRMIKQLKEERIFSVSRKVARDLSEAYGLDENKITVVRGASRFVQEHNPQEQPERALSLGMVGNNFHAKGILLFTRVAEELKKLGFEVRGTIVGCDEKTDATIRNLGGDNIMIHGKMDIGKEFYRNLTCFLSLSAYEGYSLSTLEAMALGIPVISSDLNGVFYDTQLEDPSLTIGRVNDIRDITEIVNLIERITTDDTFRESLIRKGFKIVEKSSWQAVARAYETEYRQLN